MSECDVRVVESVCLATSYVVTKCIAYTGIFTKQHEMKTLLTRKTTIKAYFYVLLFRHIKNSLIVSLPGS